VLVPRPLVALNPLANEGGLERVVAVGQGEEGCAGAEGEAGGEERRGGAREVQELCWRAKEGGEHGGSDEVVSVVKAGAMCDDEEG
jgi:hypothetical protein